MASEDVEATQATPLLAESSPSVRATVGTPADDAAAQVSFTRNLGTAEAFAVVIGVVIGSGIFTSPGSIDTNVPSPGAALLVWLVGGILAWTGAATLAELGTAIPGEGGLQPFLRYIYGDVFGFLVAWTWIVVVMPATMAILSIVFVESLFSAIGITLDAGLPSHKLFSVLLIVLTGIVTSVSTKTTTRLNGFFVVVKFTCIAAVVIAGIAVVGFQVAHPDREDVGGRDWFTKPWFGTRPTLNPDGSTTDWERLSSWEILGHYSTALYGALWAYSGWDKAIYITSELTKPAKQLPLAINSAIPTIMLCFLTANAAYYILLPWNVLSTTDSVAVTAINRLLGRGFGIAAAILICLVVAGSQLANFFVVGRMTVAAAKRDWLPRSFAVLGRFGTEKRREIDGQETPTETGESTSDAPINATILATVLSALYVLFGNFRALLTFNGIGEYAFFCLTVVGAIVLRFREPDLPRPYKTSLLVPVVFVVVSGFVVIRGAIFEPVLAAVLVVLWLAGFAVYWARNRMSSRTTE